MGEINPNTTFYQIITESIFDGLIQIDVDGEIILWNKGAERITGYPAQKMAGRNFREIFVKILGESGEQLRENSSLITLHSGWFKINKKAATWLLFYFLSDKLIACP